jgi:hypothetical protein
MPARHFTRGRLAALAVLSCLAAGGCAAGTPAGTPAGVTTPAAATAHGQPGPRGPAGTAAGTPTAAWTVLPAQLGDSWVYAVDSSVLGTGTETVRITAVKPVAGGQQATMAVSMRLAGSTAPLNFTAQFTDAADGSITFASTSFMGARLAFSSASWPSPAALTPGRPRTSTITQTGLLGSRATERVTISDIGPALVTVPAGSYQATLLEQTATTSKGSQSVVKTWVVNGIGQIKTETTVIVEGKPFATSVQTLTSFTKG